MKNIYFLLIGAIVSFSQVIADDATEAYIYGYPLVTMEITRRVMTNTVEPKDNKAPMGQFYHARSYPDASFKDVTAPNADTLYSTAWLDLSEGPYVLHLPDADGRYYLMPLLSGWTEVFEVPGTRTTGTKEANYAITGPNWKGKLPEGLKELKSPTNMVWVLGRTYCNGTPEDYEAVHKIQNQYSLVPLSSYGKTYTPPKGKLDSSIDTKTPVRDQVNHLSATEYFTLLKELLKNNPPAKEDAPIVAKLNKLSEVSPDVPQRALKEILAHAKEAGKEVNGWTFSLKTGVYGTDYLQRAYITFVGLGANRPQDAVYPMTSVDKEGQPLDGSNRYVIRFAKGQTPPVKGFWSLTMYNDQLFFVSNPLNRYTLSTRNNLKYNEDGSLDLYIQNENPGKEKESNWLPAPKGKFVLMLRTYWPEEAILNGKWVPPFVEKQ